MPKSKEYISDSDSDGSDLEPKPKKTKKEKKPEKSASSASKNKETSFQLSKMRFASVSEFRGKPYVNIREFYEKDGDLLPGKKGISLTPEQWEKLKSHMEDIDKALKEY